jgi:hypothetical protein
MILFHVPQDAPIFKSFQQFLITTFTAGQAHEPLKNLSANTRNNALVRAFSGFGWRFARLFPSLHFRILNS